MLCLKLVRWLAIARMTLAEKAYQGLVCHPSLYQDLSTERRPAFLVDSQCRRTQISDVTSRSSTQDWVTLRPSFTGSILCATIFILSSTQSKTGLHGKRVEVQCSAHTNYTCQNRWKQIITYKYPSFKGGSPTVTSSSWKESHIWTSGVIKVSWRQFRCFFLRCLLNAAKLV